MEQKANKCTYLTTIRIAKTVSTDMSLLGLEQHTGQREKAEPNNPKNCENEHTCRACLCTGPPKFDGYCCRL